MDIYGIKIYDLKTRVDVLTRMDVVTVEYGIFYQTFQLKMWFFKCITGIIFRWDYVMWWIVALPK